MLRGESRSSSRLRRGRQIGEDLCDRGVDELMVGHVDGADLCGHASIVARHRSSIIDQSVIPRSSFVMIDSNA